MRIVRLIQKWLNAGVLEDGAGGYLVATRTGVALQPIHVRGAPPKRPAR